MEDIKCPRCDHEFEHQMWESGECPKCKNEFCWDEQCTEDYSDCWPLILWENYDKIPKGVYCYDENGICPYWSKQKDKPDHDNGYCSFLGRGDWEVEGLSLLWDQVKECGLNRDIF
jgi:hypothetical protein